MARALGGQGDKECYYTPWSLVLLTIVGGGLEMR